MSKDTADRVRKLCLAIRTRTDNYSTDIKHWLHSLENLGESGWPSDSLPMLQLCNDSQALAELSDLLLEMARKLEQQETPDESS